MSKITFTQDQHAYRITLNDPPLNILDIAMLTDVRDALMRVQNDRALLIIAAEGEKAFSAGASVQDHMGDRVEKMLTTFHDCFRLLNRLQVVTVAMVKGLALGGGSELAFASDFVLASDRAKFGQPEINLGVFPPVAAYQLSRLMPPRVGLELYLTGKTIDAATAQAYGLINAVFPLAEFDREAETWLAQVTQHSASSIRFAKRAFRLAQTDDFEKKLDLVERMYLEELMRTEDAEEGLVAFMEKRKPVWKGR